MNESIQFLNSYCDFTDPNWVWILTGLSRSKDNTVGYHDVLKRFVLTKPEDIQACYDRVHQETKDPNTTYRMYISLNARDAKKCAFKFGQRIFTICEGLANGQSDCLVVAKKLGSEWKSELAQSHCRATKRILLDIDTNDTTTHSVLKRYLIEHNAKIHTIRPSKSGLHIVIDACDTRDFINYCKRYEIPVDLQRDSMVYVESWRNSP